MSVNLGSAIAYLDVDSTKFTSGFAKAKNELKVFNDDTATTSQKLGGLSSAMGSAGSTMTKGFTLPLVGIGTAAVAVGSQFEAGMSKVKAISGSSAEQMEMLRDKAIEMGAKTKFSAGESADAFQYMAMAGWDASQMVDGIGGIMSLAASDGLDLATTSDIVTDSLTAFGLGASDAGKFADTLAAASSAANLNVSMLGESFKYVAPVAGALGYTVEDTSVALGLMANSGIKGSQAGTALRSALTNLASPTKEMSGVMNELGISITNEDGSMKSLDTTMGELREAFKGTTEEQRQANYASIEAELLNSKHASTVKSLTGEEKNRFLEYQKGIPIVESLSKEELKKQANDTLGIKLTKDRKLTDEEYYKLAQTLGQESILGLTEAKQADMASTLFGKEAMSGMLAIINTSEEDYNKLSDAINNSTGRADEMAATMQDNLMGSLEQAGGSIETLSIRLSEILIPIVRDVVDWFTGVIDKLNSMNDSTLLVITVIGGLVAAIGPVLLIVASMIKAFMSVHATFLLLQPVIAAIGTFIAGLSTPILLIGGLVAAFALAWSTNFMGIRDKTDEIMNEIQNLITVITEAIGELIDSFLSYVRTLWESNFLNIQGITDSIMNIIRTIIDTVMTVIKDLIKLTMQIIQGDWRGAWETVKTIFSTIWEAIKTLLSNFLSALVDIIVGGALLIYNSAKETFGRAEAAFKEVWEAIKTWFSKAIDDPVNTIKGIGTAMYNAGSEIFNKLWDGAKAIWTKIESWVNDAVDWIVKKVKFWEDQQDKMSDDSDDRERKKDKNNNKGPATGPGRSFRSGLDYVPYDGYTATLHTGERVLTQEENKRGVNTGGDTYNFYGTKPLDERETVRQFKKAQREIALS